MNGLMIAMNIYGMIPMISLTQMLIISIKAVDLTINLV